MSGKIELKRQACVQWCVYWLRDEIHSSSNYLFFLQLHISASVSELVPTVYCLLIYTYHLLLYLLFLTGNATFTLGVFACIEYSPSCCRQTYLWLSICEESFSLNCVWHIVGLSFVSTSVCSCLDYFLLEKNHVLLGFCGWWHL